MYTTPFLIRLGTINPPLFIIKLNLMKFEVSVFIPSCFYENASLHLVVFNLAWIIWNNKISGGKWAL